MRQPNPTSGLVPELLLLVVALAFSLALPGPARFLVDHHGLDVALAALVFVTGVGIPAATFSGVADHAGRLAAAVAASAVALPVLSWAASRLVASPTLRHGVLAAGLAPAEIASVATTSLAGGDPAVAAGVLAASTALAVVGAGVGLRLLGGGGRVPVLSLLGNLVVIVALPLVAGTAMASRLRPSARREVVVEKFSLAFLVVLVWLVASQVRLTGSTAEVVGALLVFLAGSACLGVIVGFRARGDVARALLLTTSMRDFAIGAAIAAAAFGAGAAAPLGLYGVIVIGWGLVLARLYPLHPDIATD